MEDPLDADYVYYVDINTNSVKVEDIHAKAQTDAMSLNDFKGYCRLATETKKTH
jgi:hypothetical protein